MRTPSVRRRASCAPPPSRYDRGRLGPGAARRPSLLNGPVGQRRPAEVAGPHQGVREGTTPLAGLRRPRRLRNGNIFTGQNMTATVTFLPNVASVASAARPDMGRCRPTRGRPGRLGLSRFPAPIPNLSRSPASKGLGRDSGRGAPTHALSTRSVAPEAWSLRLTLIGEEQGLAPDGKAQPRSVELTHRIPFKKGRLGELDLAAVCVGDVSGLCRGYLCRSAAHQWVDQGGFRAHKFPTPRLTIFRSAQTPTAPAPYLLLTQRE